MADNKRRVFDYEAKDADTLKAAVETIQSIFPIKTKNRTLRLNKLTVGKRLPSDDYASMKKAFYAGRSWGTSVHASLDLIDNDTGAVIDSASKIKLIDVPRMTPMHGYIVDGKFCYPQNQVRLLPGAYSTITGDGGYQTQLMTARGHNHKINLDPRSGVMTITPSGSSSAVKLLPVLLDLGVSDKALRQAWGDEVFESNLQASQKVLDTETQKFHKTLFRRNKGYKMPVKETAIADLQDYLQTRTEIDPETTERMLGRPFKKVTPSLLVASTQKLLKISRGEDRPDDRNSIANKGLFSVDSFLRERLLKSEDRITQALSRQMEKRDQVREIVSHLPFTKPIKAFFNSSSLVSPIKQTNPMDMIGETFKVTLMGEGGIGSLRAIREEARLLHGSHLGVLDPVRTPEGDHIGISLSVSAGAQAMPDNSLAQTLINVRTGKQELVKVKDLANKTVAFPGEYKQSKGKWVPSRKSVRAIRRFSDAAVSPGDVDYLVPDAKGMFTITTNLIPFANSISGPRLMMGSKQTGQALPLENPEPPLVQCSVNPAVGKSWERVIGGSWTATADAPGEVVKVFKHSIHVRGPDGKMKVYGTFDHFPLNETTYFHSRPKVKVGDQVKAGQTLADNTFTQDGTLSLGKNLLTAYLPHPSGKSFEDGVVLSESAAKKLTSKHLHRVVIKGGENITLDKERLINRFPGIYTPEQLKKLDDKGLPKPGQRLGKGDPVGLRLVQEALSPEDKILQQLRRGFIQPLKNRTTHWESDYEGEVVEVHRQGKDYVAVVKTLEPAREGDKTSGRVGNKGIITAVMPDAKMPRTKDGKIIDIMLNPQGVVARMNTAQTLENLAAKVAVKAGNRVIHVNNFDEGSNFKKVMDLAKKYKVSDKEDLIDPSTGRAIPSVAVGYNYTYKLDHPVKKKFSAHSLGPYDSEGIPLRGHDFGAQSLDLLTTYTLLAHGAKNILKESALKGGVNFDWWRAYRMGHLPPLPRHREVFSRFSDMLRGAGIQVTQKGSVASISPCLDRHVDEFSNGEIQKPRQVWAKNLAPEKYGLFDPKITGGLQGKKWGHIQLTEPMPHPTFSDPIRLLTGLTQAQMNGLVEHRVFLDPDTFEPRSYGPGLTGGAAIREALKSINVDARLRELKAKLPKLKRTALDKANRQIRYLQALKETGIKPEEYVIDKLPVLPPSLRPVYPDEAGDLRHSDLNYLYRDLMLLNEGLQALEGLPEGEKTKQRRDIQDALRALVGVTSEPALIAGEERKGIFHTISGIPQPKMGYYQSKLLSRRQDLSGRSTIVGEPSLELDQVGLPEEMAWTLFKERGLRELIKRGRTPLRAEEIWEARDGTAKGVLQDAMRDTPVILNRAPTLHKHGVQAFYGVLRPGKAIGIHPLVTKGYNADFDGDTMSVFVPVLPDAVEEARKMVPSRNLWNPRDGTLMYMPEQEVVQGLYLLTKKPGVGREQINALLPEEYRDPKRVWTSKAMREVLTDLSRSHPKDFPHIVDELKDAGNAASYFLGSTLGASDFDVDLRPIWKVLSRAELDAQKIRDNKTLSEEQKEEALINIFKRADSQVLGLTKKSLPKGGQLEDMVLAGAKAKMDQVKQTVGACVLYESGKGGSIPVMVSSNFTHGLPIGEYWASLYGARKGMIDKGMATAKPGELGKYTASSLLRFLITEKDCGTEGGTVINLKDAKEAKSLVGRVLAEDLNGFKAGTHLTLAHVHDLLKTKRETVKVRTPIDCESAEGVCQECYGNKPDTQEPPYVGENVGVHAAQSTSEPGVQLTMKAFHTAGSSSSKESAGLTSQFDQINKLLTVPKVLPGATTLAEADGRVEKVEKGAAGGTNVTINGRTYFLSQSNEVSLKEGDEVKKGDPLGDGPVNPHDLLGIMGAEKTKEYLSKELRRLYDTGGTPLSRVHADLVSRAMLDVAEVEDPGDHPDVIRGDTVPIPKLTGFRPHDHPVETPVERCAGRTLAKDYGDLKRNLYLTDADVAKLQGMGLKNVMVYALPPRFKPKLTGVNQLPVVGTTDWMARMGAHGLKTTLSRGAAQLYKSDITGVHPLPRHVVGHGDWSGPVPKGGKFDGFGTKKR